VPSTEIAWPSEADQRLAEHPDYVRLCRVLVGLRRLSVSDRPAVTPGVVDMPRDTHKLVDLLEAAQTRIGLLAARLQDGTATTEEQRRLADEIDDLLDLLRSHATDVDAGIVAAPRYLRDLERESA
jgi:hypothetical protein